MISFLLFISSVASFITYSSYGHIGWLIAGIVLGVIWLFRILGACPSCDGINGIDFGDSYYSDNYSSGDSDSGGGGGDD
jgi:hypothetical protein